jgi:hypothetical protein
VPSAKIPDSRDGTAAVCRYNLRHESTVNGPRSTEGVSATRSTPGRIVIGEALRALDGEGLVTPEPLDARRSERSPATIGDQREAAVGGEARRFSRSPPFHNALIYGS